MPTEREQRAMDVRRARRELAMPHLRLKITNAQDGAAEGLRRGVVLSAGDDVSAISLAVELMEEMIAAFTPAWASGGR